MKTLLRVLTACTFSLGLAIAPMTAAVAQDAPPKSKGGKGGGGGPKQPQPSGNRGGGGGNKTGKIAGGIAAGIAGAIIPNEIAKSQRDERGGYRQERIYRDEGGLSCRQLERRCDDGQGWACRKLDREC